MPPPSTKPSRTATALGKAKTGILRWLDVIYHHPWISVVAILAVGGAGVATIDATDYYYSSQNFCAFTCHVMESTVYEELQQSKHWTNPSGVRPKCADCHVSKRLTFAMWDHFIGTGELFVWLTHDLSKPGAFEELRPAAADRVRFQMLENDSEKCRECHVMEGIKPKRKRGQRMHASAREENTTCIVCHYNLVHKEVEPSKAFLEAIEAE
jgi:nitrate/TMAO reductase-like tetraheme cytochrome c subunit